MILAKKLAKYCINKSKEEWKRKWRNVDGKEVEIPDSLNGEILLETVIDENGRCRGWITVHPEILEQVFEDAIQEHLATGKPLGLCLLESDDVFIEVESGDNLEEEILQALSKFFPGKSRDVLKKSRFFKRALSEIKTVSLSSNSKIKIKIGEKGYKKYIQKWIEEGLI